MPENPTPTIAGEPIVVPPVIGYKGEYILHQAATLGGDVADLINEWGQFEADYQATHPLPFTKDMLELPRFAGVVSAFGLTADMFTDADRALLLPINTPEPNAKWLYFATRLGREKDNMRRVERVACLLLCPNDELRAAYKAEGDKGVDAMIATKFDGLMFDATINELRAVVGYMIGVVIDHLQEAGVLTPEAVDGLGEAVGQVLGTAPAPTPTPTPEPSDEAAATA